MASRILVVTPTYDERDNLRTLVDGVLSAMPSAEILVVDDGSPDGTGELAEALARSDRRVHVLRRPGKLGLGTAYVEGFRWARERGYDRVAQMDADGSHDPAALPGLVGRLDEADLVVGSRAVEGGAAVGWGAHRHLISGAGAVYCRLLLGMAVKDPTSGYRALGRAAIETLLEGPVRSEGFAFQVEVAYRLSQRGLRVVEHPIRFVDRAAGRSKLSAGVVVEAALVVPLLRLSSLAGVL